jgi:hypothetical protein
MKQMSAYGTEHMVWKVLNGMEGAQSLERPYPLRPGTAILGLGECYSCGMVTDPMHLSSQCTATSQLRPHETQWCQYVAGLLRRAAQQQIPQIPYPTPVQYITTMNHLYVSLQGNTMSAPVYHIAPLPYPIHSRFSSEVLDVRSNQIRSTDPYQIRYDKLLHSYPVHITLNTAYFLHLVYPPFRFIGYAFFGYVLLIRFTCD